MAASLRNCANLASNSVKLSSQWWQIAAGAVNGSTTVLQSSLAPRSANCQQQQQPRRRLHSAPARRHAPALTDLSIQASTKCYISNQQKRQYATANNTGSGPIPVPESMLLPLKFPHKLLMGPGPSNVSPRVLAAGARPVIGHMHPEMWGIMNDIKEGMQYAFQTRNKYTVAISGSGHGAMEAACVNTLEQGDVALVLESGLWGQRFAEMVERNGSDLRLFSKPSGGIFTLEEIEEALQKHQPKIMFITQGESTAGTLQPLQGVGPLCHKYGTLLIVDCVAALGGTPMYMDDWEIDVLYTGAQKALGSPSGSSPISFSPRAIEKVKNRKTKVRSFYFDILGIGNFWGCDDEPRNYHHTVLTNALFNLRESLAMLAEETLEASWERHEKNAHLLWEGLEQMGLELLVEDPKYRLPTVTTIKLPTDIDWKAVTAYANDKYLLEIAGGLGPKSYGRMWRIGVMGYNACPENVRYALRALQDSINHVRGKAE